jgi:DNA-binding response OmpR family regulator
MAKIVIVDDDRKLVDLLKTYLAENNHTVSFYTNPKDFLKQDIDRFDLVILDILMPEIDGFDVLREVRKKSSTGSR